jgi:hypothetical protein
MYKHVPRSQGLVVKISTYRKNNNGKTLSKRSLGEGRGGGTGKTAVVTDRTGVVLREYREPNFRKLSIKLRGDFNIHPGVVIKNYGVTAF